MLSKQVWRLLCNPESLCARILKAKYYPNQSILEAGPKKGSSFTWQSIFAGIQTFKRGCIWRVGNGDSIDIWRDPWVPTSPDRKVMTPRGNIVITKVSELIDPQLGQWDEDLVRSLFTHVDAARIFNIPLSLNGFDDFVAWHYNRNKMFSVRSAYHVEWRHQFGNSYQYMASSSRGSNPIWQKVWKISVPGKVKTFVWKVLHGAIPVKSVLVNRHIGTDSLCPICHKYAEDLKHLLFDCSPAQEL